MAASHTLTVFFDDPFWVGVVELRDGGAYSVARHVFGAEPTMPEVERFVQFGLKRLKYADALSDESEKPAKINPKRMQRMVKKEMEKNPLKGTQAQRAISAQREEAAQGRKEASRERKQAEKDARFEQRSRKRKEKHKGH